MNIIVSLNGRKRIKTIRTENVSWNQSSDIHIGTTLNLFDMKIKPFMLQLILLVVVGFVSCKSDVRISSYSKEISPLVKEYADVIIPYNIAPLNFYMLANDGEEALVFSYEGMKLSAICKDGAVIPDLDAWKTMLGKAKGDTIKVVHCVKSHNGWEA